jgi:hypothetical protein
MAHFTEGCNAQNMLEPRSEDVSNKPRALHTYGDTGLAAFSRPGMTAVPSQGAFASRNNVTVFNLPVRTPGGTSLPADMDTSPDNSGDQQTSPGSSTHGYQNFTSSGTSHTGYSPSNGQTQDPTSNIYPSNGTSFAAEYTTQDFPASSTYQQQSGFVLPQSWNGSSGMNTGSTPGSGGGGVDSILLTGGFGDLVNGLTEADWDNMLQDTFTGWESGVEPPATFMSR